MEIEKLLDNLAVVNAVLINEKASVEVRKQSLNTD